MTIRHTSDIEITKVLVFLKQAIALCSLMQNSELDLVAAEIIEYTKFGDPEDQVAGKWIATAVLAYKEAE
jgi:hypothetical protein